MGRWMSDSTQSQMSADVDVEHASTERSSSVMERTSFALHPDVLKLGFVSFLTDISSEMIFSVFAVFFTTVAGASSALLGLIEGFADFAASSLDYLAGWLSDRAGKRKAVSGVIYLPAALIAGALWAVNPQLVFVVAAVISLLAIGTFVLVRPR